MNAIPQGLVFAALGATIVAQSQATVPAAHNSDDAVAHLWLAGAGEDHRRQTIIGASHLGALIGKQITALELMEDRVGTLMQEYGIDDLADLAGEIQARTEQAMRAAIRNLPDGTYSSELKMDGLGEPLELKVKLTVDGDEVASEHLPRTIAFRMSLDETLDIGHDTGTPVSEDYEVPFDFTGELETVTINITEHELTEEQLQAYREGRLKAALAQ